MSARLFDPAVARRAARDLAARDPQLAPLIRAGGPLRLPVRAPGGVFGFLVRAVVFQQLAAPAASAIHRRVTRALGDGRGRITPDAVLSGLSRRRRALGVSGPKTRTLLALAEAAADEGLSTAALSRLSDEAIVERLTRIPGIGPWTAEMVLIFHLGRPDVLPATDLGIRYGVALLHGETSAWPPRRVLEHGERWRPWRSAAAWWLWCARSGARPGMD